MVNRLVEGRIAALVLYGGMLLYLALGMTTTQVLMWWGARGTCAAGRTLPRG